MDKEEIRKLQELLDKIDSISSKLKIIATLL
jgi:hypothetical protein